MYKVKVQMGYDSLTFKFDNVDVAETFVDTAFNSIVRDKNSEGNLMDVTITINRYMTTRKEEEEEED